MSGLSEMLIDQLRDAFSAEKQALQGMKRVLKKVSEPQLKEGMEAHAEQSEQQRERVEQALRQLGSKPDRTVCEAMRGLVEESQHEIEDLEKGPVMDLTIVASLQRIEHYEIAAYGTMAELAEATGQDEIATVLREILEQEKAQDLRLTELTRSVILPAALAAEADGETEEPEPANPAKRGAAKKGA